ncbi:Protein of unknown function, partial [Gryllus bimaculatus]
GGVPRGGRVPVGRPAVCRGHARGAPSVRRVHHGIPGRQDARASHPPAAVPPGRQPHHLAPQRSSADAGRFQHVDGASGLPVVDRREPRRRRGRVGRRGGRGQAEQQGRRQRGQAGQRHQGRPPPSAYFLHA